MLRSTTAKAELDVACDAIRQIMGDTVTAVTQLDMDAARKIEPLEEVVDDLIAKLRKDHIQRLHAGICTTSTGIQFLDVLINLERISDQCSNIGLFTLSLKDPHVMESIHDYARYLHSGQDTEFNQAYKANHEQYFGRLDAL